MIPFWKFSFEPPLAPSSEIHCPRCGAWARGGEWYLDDQGSLTCPQCQECIPEDTDEMVLTRPDSPESATNWDNKIFLSRPLTGPDMARAMRNILSQKDSEWVAFILGRLPKSASQPREKDNSDEKCP